MLIKKNALIAHLVKMLYLHVRLFFGLGWLYYIKKDLATLPYCRTQIEKNAWALSQTSIFIYPTEPSLFDHLRKKGIFETLFFCPYFFFLLCVLDYILCSKEPLVTRSTFPKFGKMTFRGEQTKGSLGTETGQMPR